jgi:hypothetical protein
MLPKFTAGVDANGSSNKRSTWRWRVFNSCQGFQRTNAITTPLFIDFGLVFCAFDSYSMAVKIFGDSVIMTAGMMIAEPVLSTNFLLEASIFN